MEQVESKEIPEGLLKDHVFSKAIVDMLAKAEHRRPEAWILDPEEPLRGNDQMVRIQINNRLRQCLGELDVNTEENTRYERSHLTLTGDPETWLEGIKNAVVPTMVSHDLPRANS